MRLALAPCLLVLLLPAATAELTLTVVEGPGTIEPDTEVAMLTLRVALDCQTALRSVDPTKSTLQVGFTFALPPGLSGVTVGGPQGAVLPVRDCPAAETVQVEHRVSLTAASTMPGLTPYELGVTAATHPSNPEPVAEPATAEAKAPFEVGYHPLVRAKLDQKILQVRPGQEGAWTVGLSNEGNADAVVAFSLGSEDPAFAFALPPPVTVPRGGVAHAEVRVVADGTLTTNMEKAFQFVLSHHAAKDPSLTGKPITANVLVQVRGDAAAPAPSVLWVPLLLGAAAVAARRHR